VPIGTTVLIEQYRLRHSGIGKLSSVPNFNELENHGFEMIFEDRALNRMVATTP